MGNIPVFETAKLVDEKRLVHLLPGKKQGAVGIDFRRDAPSSPRKPCVDQNGKIQAVKQSPKNNKKSKKPKGQDDLFLC
jgi:hypothetical protein